MIQRIIVVDDIFGRDLVTGRNTDRENLCATFLLKDATGDMAASRSRQEVLSPLAEVEFCRGQCP